MNETLKALLETVAAAAGVTLTEGVHGADMLRDSGRMYCCAALKASESEPRINARNGTTIGVEEAVTLALRFYGRRCGYADLSELESRADSLVRSLAISGSCLALSSVKGEAERCSPLGRLETLRLVRIRLLTLCTEEEE